MLFRSLTAVLIALPGVLSGPVIARNETASTQTHSTCLTNYGPTSSTYLPSCTKKHSHTLTARHQSTFIPTLTVTLAPSTSTVIYDETTAVTVTVPRETDTFTSTLSFDTTTTLTETTSTTTTTVTTTTVTQGSETTTVETTAGFTPVQSVQGNPPAKRALPTGPAARIAAASIAAAAEEVPDTVLEARKVETPNNQLAVENGKCVEKPARYPHAIHCYVDVEVITTVTEVSSFSGEISVIEHDASLLAS